MDIDNDNIDRNLRAFVFSLSSILCCPREMHSEEILQNLVEIMMLHLSCGRIEHL